MSEMTAAEMREEILGNHIPIQLFTQQANIQTEHANTLYTQTFSGFSIAIRPVKTDPRSNCQLLPYVYASIIAADPKRILVQGTSAHSANDALRALLSTTRALMEDHYVLYPCLLSQEASTGGLYYQEGIRYA